MAGKRKRYSDVEILFIVENYSSLNAAEIAEKIDGTLYSVYNIAHRLRLKKGQYPWNKNTAGMGICRGNSGCFKKGHVPANKGKKGISTGGVQTQFKKGHLPQNTLYDGAIVKRRAKTGAWYYWYRISAGKWRMLHVKIWIEHHGPVPTGHIIVFKDRNTMNCRIENLEMITLQENMRRNTIHNYPDDLKMTMLCLGHLKRRINGKKTSLSDLRDHIFETIERLKLANDPNADPQEKIDIETAQTIANLAQVAVNSAKVEVDAIKIIARSENPKDTKDAIRRSDVLRLSENTDGKDE